MNYTICGMADSADFLFRNREWIIDESNKYIESKGLIIESGPEYDIEVIEDITPIIDHTGETVHQVNKTQVKYTMTYRVIVPRGVEVEQ
jgi:hypothetical protein